LLTPDHHVLQRFARADKRAKLPKWINQYIAETATNLSTDMAIGELPI
jgi:DNA excision repair protein ERCC-2